MLAQSLPGSTQTSPPPSPRRTLVQPIRTREGSVRDSLPPDAEFVGTSPAPPSETHGISESAFSPKYFEKFFIVEKELGRGGRGVVLLVKHVLDGVSLGHFACKRVPIGDDHEWLEKVLVEVQLLQNLSHQNLVSYRHVWLQDFHLSTFGPSVPCAFILQQYCNGGDLHNFVCGLAQTLATTHELKERIRRRSRGEADEPRKPNEPKKLPFEQIYSFFRDITAGLRYLHSQKFVHRDLKASNCLLHTSGLETRVLVSDFGEVQYESAMRKSTGATGTISYCAPEVLQRVSPDGPFGNFTFKSDIFSLGMILHFLCFANLPYRCANVLQEEKEDVDELRAEITSWQGFDDQRKQRPELPGKLYDFLKRLLSLNPDHRPTAEEVLQGIRTGGLDEPSDGPLGRSASPEELTPGRQVLPVDSPMRDLSPGNKVERPRPGPSGFPPSHPSYTRRRPIPRLSTGTDTDGEIGRIRTTESEPTRSSRQEVILSPQTTSPVSSPRSGQSPHLVHHPPLLLPPPSTITVQRRIQMLLTMTVSSTLIRISILSLKLVSLLQPCVWNSRSINPVITYPVIGLAVAETVVADYTVWQLLLGIAAHVLMLWFALQTDSLCSYPRVYDMLEPGMQRPFER